jgi:hypothetical protein
VFAKFKYGKGRQKQIDEVLTTADPSLTLSSKGETEFTEARNDFIHADERGRDPAAAMSRIDAVASRFIALVGRRLRKG